MMLIRRILNGIIACRWCRYTNLYTVHVTYCINNDCINKIQKNIIRLWPI